MRAAVASVLLALVAATGCARRSPDLLPPTGEAADWMKGRVRAFEAADLWRYIDGDAERFLQAGVERTLTADYRYRDKADAVADVHLMRDPAAARRIFESEPPAGSRPIEVGEAGRHYGASLTFRRGRFFVRLVAYQQSPELDEALLALARAVDGRLQEAPE